MSWMLTSTLQIGITRHNKPNKKKLMTVDATIKRRKWDEVLAKHSHLKRQGSLRLHIILPHIRTKPASSLCRVEGNDILIYVDKQNAKLLFDKTTCELLAAVTNTNGW